MINDFWHTKHLKKIPSKYQKLKVITKTNEGKFGEENIISVRFVPMIHSIKINHNKGN